MTMVMMKMLAGMMAVALLGGMHVAATELQCNTTSDAQDAAPRWTRASSGLTFSRDSHAAAVFQDQIWVVGGVSTSYYTKRLEATTYRSDVLSSSDAATWTEVLEEAPFRRRYGHSLTVFTEAARDRLVLLGGFSPEPANDVWTSTDGATWLEATPHTPHMWTGRGYHCTVAFADRLWVMGGSPLNNQVWSTTSVLNGPWRQQDALTVPWSPRAAHACAVHAVMTNQTLGDASTKRYVFLLGGWDASSLQDVYRMDSSGTWTQLLQTAPWTPRGWHALVSFHSLVHEDVVQGPRLWLLGGGRVGNGISSMVGADDVWFTRDGRHWVRASSSSSGVSTAEWSMLSTRDKDVCLGKWGLVVVAFRRAVARGYACSDACVNQANTTQLGEQTIAVCRPQTTHAPDPPVTHTVMRDNSVVRMRLYPDACGLCMGERYVNTTTVPALVTIAGNVGTQKVGDVFVSDDAMLCEQDGVICSNLGTCTQGGTCLCVTGKTGQFCESDLDYTIVDSASCFPPSATVVTRARGVQPLRDVAVGDAVWAMDMATGQLVFSTVYYLPHGHEAHARTEVEFIRVHHRSLVSGQLLEPLEITPSHLLYVLGDGDIPNDRDGGDGGGGRQTAWVSPRLVQKTARELQVHDRLITLLRDPSQPANASIIITASSRVMALEPHTATGAMTLYTYTGTVFVDGVLCSNFADLYPNAWPSWVPSSWAARRHHLPIATTATEAVAIRDRVVFALFLPHRVAFKLLPFPSTAHGLRLLMDAVVLPMLRLLRTWWPPADAQWSTAVEAAAVAAASA